MSLVRTPREDLRALVSGAAALLLVAGVLAVAPGGAARAADEPAAKSAGKDEQAGKGGKGGKGGKDGGTPGYYATTVGRSDLDLILVHYWSRGSSFRSETIVAGHPIITLVRGSEYYTWDALTLDGYVVRRTPAAIALDAKRSRPFGLERDEIVAEGGEKIRSETLNGVRVDVYQATDDSGRRTLWVDAERLDLPIRLETYSRSSGRTGQLDWISWIPGLVIPDSFFEPPREVKFVRFDSYEAYLQRLSRGPLPPAPPLFHYLLHALDAGDVKKPR